MIGTPTKLASVTWHLGRRKPEVESALAAGRAQIDLKGWEAFRRHLRAHAGDAPDFNPSRSQLQLGDAGGVAFVPPHLARRAAVLRLASPGPRRELRVCTSLAPDALRAALAGLGDLRSAVAWIPKGDALRRELAAALGFGRIEELGDDAPPAPLLTPAAWELAALQGFDGARMRLALHEATTELRAADAPAEGDPAALAALALGLANRGAVNWIAAAPPELQPLLEWLESAAAQLPERAGFSLLAAAALEEPGRYPDDRWCANYLVAPAPGAAASDPVAAEHAHRARRLIGAGVPLVQFELPSMDALAGELVRWTWFFSLAWGAPEAAQKGATVGSAPAVREADLREGPLALRAATATHAFMLRKVAGTLGAKAESSVPAWLAAQAAMGEPGEHLSLHWLGLPTGEARQTMREAQRAMSGPNQIAVRSSFSLPEMPASDSAQALAGASSRGLFFLLSDGGGAELCGSRRAALAAEDRTFAQLAQAGRRAILLRAEDGDASKLASALRAAEALLTP